MICSSFLLLTNKINCQTSADQIKKAIKGLAYKQLSPHSQLFYELIGSSYWCPHSSLTCFLSLKKSERILNQISFTCSKWLASAFKRSSPISLDRIKNTPQYQSGLHHQGQIQSGGISPHCPHKLHHFSCRSPLDQGLIL